MATALGFLGSLAEVAAAWESYRADWPAVPSPDIVADDTVVATYEGVLDPKATLRCNTPLWEFDLRHEFGHAVHWAALYRMGYTTADFVAGRVPVNTPDDPVLLVYWRARGITDPIAGHFGVDWSNLAIEAFADTFAVVAFPPDPAASERTFARTYPLDPSALLAFYRGLLPEEELVRRYVSQPFPVNTDASGNADVVVPLEGLAAGAATYVSVQRVGTTGVEQRLPGLIGQSTGADAGLRATVRVRGDFIANGQIWLQLLALQ